MEDVGLKILRVSQETGYVLLIVRHNGVADPHTHVGASDFLVLQGQLGVRADLLKVMDPVYGFMSLQVQDMTLLKELRMRI